MIKEGHPVAELARRYITRMTEEHPDEFLKEYTFDEAAAILSKEFPDLGMTRGRVREWVIEKKLCDYRVFPLSPGSIRTTYRIDEENLQKLIKLGRDWYAQATPRRKRKEKPDE